MSDCDKDLPKGRVNNEDIINELTNDLEASLHTSEQNSSENKPPIIEPSNENGDSHPDFIINENSTNNKSDDKKCLGDMKDDLDNNENEKHSDDSGDEDDDVDIVALKDNEVNLSESEKEVLKVNAEKHKIEGNERFKLMEYEASIECYTQGLRICPLAYPKDRATIYGNRAAAKMKLSKNEQAIKDCTRAIEMDSTYIKAYYRRAQCYEMTQKYDECLADFNKILELDPQHQEARRGVLRLPPLIEERNEKLKTEMFGKLKDLGNMILRPFGLSTENFQMVQDPETKGYSINFSQNK